MRSHVLLDRIDFARRATMKDDFKSPLPPPDPPGPIKRPLLAPAWVALLAAWLGLFALIASVVFPFLPGSKDPRAELEHLRPYAFADRFIPLPIYASVVAMFLGLIVLYQMRKEPQPLEAALISQRTQAWAGILLALLGAAVIYASVAWHGPRSAP
jgi:hypothetical protein